MNDRYYNAVLCEENRYWQAKWIWDVPQPEPNGTNQQCLVYFRKTFQIAEGIRPSLKLDVTADSRYRLFINGQSVTVGPCKGTPQVQYYDSVDVSAHLQEGTNVLAVQVLRFPSFEPFEYGVGGPTSVWRSQSAGLFVEGSLKDADGKIIEQLHTDASWRVFRHRGYQPISSPLIMWMGGVEEVDGHGAPHQWQSIEYKDTDWTSAVEFAELRGYGLLSPWQLAPRPIPSMYEEQRHFHAITRVEHIECSSAEALLHSGVNSSIRLEAGQKIVLELDAAELTTGYLNIGMLGGKGSNIRLLCAECYEAQESNENKRIKGQRNDSRGKLLGDFDVYHVAGYGQTSSLPEIYEPFWFRTFRYVRLEIEVANEPLQLLWLHYRETGYPLDVKAEFSSSDEELNQLWELSLRTLRRCMHETYEDCPYYEQLQYMMDSRLMMLFTYYLSADDRLPRRTISDFYQSRMPSGLLQSRYPSVDPQVIPSFALYWIDMLAEHYEHMGDLTFIKKYRSTVLELLDWFQERITDEGIVGVTSNRYWTYFDWVDEWPLGSPPESADRPMMLLSLMYAAALRKSSELFRLTGWNEVASEMLLRSEKVCQAVNTLSWSAESQLYRELPGTEIYTQHSQIMAVLAGAIKGDQAKELLLRALDIPMHRVTLPYSFLLMQALKQTGLQEKLFGLWDRWRNFIHQGLTTLPETEVNPRSDCHAWSSLPLAEFPSTILGVTPIEPGFTRIRIAPVLGTLKWAKGKVATINGIVEVDWKREASEFRITARVPDGLSAVLVLPDGTEHLFSHETSVSMEMIERSN